MNCRLLPSKTHPATVTLFAFLAGMPVHDVGKIQISQNLEFLKKEWRVQRLGWIVFALILLIALSGLLGRGPLAHTTARDGTLRVDYDRVLRHGASTDMRIEVGPGAQSDSTFRIYVSADYLDKLDHTELQPAPVTSGYSGEFAFFDFVRLDAGQPAAVIIYAEPKRYGRISARVATDGGARLSISQLILP